MTQKHLMSSVGIARWFLWGMLFFSITPVIAQMPAPPAIAAKSYLLIDVTAGQTLAASEIDSAMEPASLTKLMAAYLVFDALKAQKISLTQTLPVSERAWKMPGSRMFISPAMKVPVEDLIKGMIVQSGNDAVVALAEGVAGSVEHFVELMNQQAKVLGMKSTVYKNPEGLTAPGHTTSARDLGALAQRLLQDFPLYTGYYALKNYHYPGTPTANDANRNLLLFRDPTVDGLKTGHTLAAGYCLIATSKKMVPNLGPQQTAGTRRLLAVVLGAKSESARADEAQKLLNWGYTAFEAVKLFEAGQPIVTVKPWKSSEAELPIGRPQAVVVAVPTGMSSKIKTQVSRPDPVFAPLAKYQSLGQLRVSIDQQALVDIPLVTLKEAPLAGVFGRAWDALRLWVQ
jgi:D-alanyl-D-alanine carboxypeptidase (penicillin-binding protein 5/6)